MNNRLRLLIIGIGALVVVAVFTFPVWRPLFNREKAANVAFPGLSPEEELSFEQLSPTQQRAYHEAIPTNATMAVAIAKAALSPDTIVPTEQQAIPTMTDPTSAATGAFIQMDAIHGASGTVTIYQQPDNSLILRFEDFHATNGPDLHVILTRNASPLTRADVGEDYIDLGALKGNVGSQNYNMPSGTDLTQYKAVVLYSISYHVVFSTAKLDLS